MVVTSLLLAISISTIRAPKPPHEFYDYLAKPDSTFSFRVMKEEAGTTEIEMTSQTWQGIPWRHVILLRQPKKAPPRGMGILYITGDGPRPGDLRDIALMTEATGMPTAMLFSIPNQPLFGDLKEDALIAHTFEEYLRTGDASWPLLFPMAKSAIRAMDAIQAVTKTSGDPLKSFVVTGASKRGWTTWFVGASLDRRVKAIAPMVIDNLNVGAQMKHQMESWGKYSEQIEDYTRLGLQAKLQSPAGQHLATIVDPYSYRAYIGMPTLIVKGSNDPYWCVDALDLYYGQLSQPKWVLTVPNAGHGLNGGVMAALTIGAFARSIAHEFPMPQTHVTTDPATAGATEAVFHLDKLSPQPQRVLAWVAESSSLDFRGSKYYTARESNGEAATKTLTVPLTKGVNSAVFLELNYKFGGRTFSLSTPTKVYRH